MVVEKKNRHEDFMGGTVVGGGIKTNECNAMGVVLLGQE